VCKKTSHLVLGYRQTPWLSGGQVFWSIQLGDEALFLLVCGFGCFLLCFVVFGGFLYLCCTVSGLSLFIGVVWFCGCVLDSVR